MASDRGDYPAEGGPGYTLDPAESTDSDELHNDDGDIVVDPPEHWSEVDKFGMTAREERAGESLDQRLAEEEPDVLTDADTDAPIDTDADDANDAAPGRAHHGQVSGTPEDGESLFEVVDE
jgi:hypothetical protein